MKKRFYLNGELFEMQFGRVKKDGGVYEVLSFIDIGRDIELNNDNFTEIYKDATGLTDEDIAETFGKVDYEKIVADGWVSQNGQYLIEWVDGFGPNFDEQFIENLKGYKPYI